MAITTFGKDSPKSARLKNSVSLTSGPLANKLMQMFRSVGKPVTIWETAARLGIDPAYPARVLDELTAQGILVKFRAGLNNYYAVPSVALTEQEPLLRDIMSDSIKSLRLLWRYRVMGKTNGVNTYFHSD
jgi:hypothetical protein